MRSSMIFRPCYAGIFCLIRLRVPRGYELLHSQIRFSAPRIRWCPSVNGIYCCRNLTNSISRMRTTYTGQRLPVYAYTLAPKNKTWLCLMRLSPSRHSSRGNFQQSWIVSTIRHTSPAPRRGLRWGVDSPWLLLSLLQLPFKCFFLVTQAYVWILLSQSSPPSARVIDNTYGNALFLWRMRRSFQEKAMFMAGDRFQQ
jgi:hypothetical protein